GARGSEIAEKVLPLNRYGPCDYYCDDNQNKVADGFFHRLPWICLSGASFSGTPKNSNAKSCASPLLFCRLFFYGFRRFSRADNSESVIIRAAIRRRMNAAGREEAELERTVVPRGAAQNLGL